MMSHPIRTCPRANCAADAQKPSVLSRGDSAVLKEGEGFRFCRGFNGIVRVAPPTKAGGHPRDDSRENDSNVTQAGTNVADSSSCRDTPSTDNICTSDSSNGDQGGASEQRAADAPENGGRSIEMSEPVKVELGAETDSGKKSCADSEDKEEQPNLGEATSTETEAPSPPDSEKSTKAIAQNADSAQAAPPTQSGDRESVYASAKVKQEFGENDASHCTISANDRTAKPTPNEDNVVPAKRARESMDVQGSDGTQPSSAGRVSSLGTSIGESTRDAAPPSQPRSEGQVPGSHSLGVQNTHAVSPQIFLSRLQYARIFPMFCRHSVPELEHVA